MGTKASELEQRNAPRRSLAVPFRMMTSGRVPQTIDGETIDVSARGLGIKFGRGKSLGIDSLLEGLVEDRVGVEVTLRLPQGSVSVHGQIMWWGLLGDDERFAMRAGVLLRDGWSEADWKLIEENLRTAG
ncbi:MAG: PilZ domain-containing protein [Candidatus Binatia bacterium]